MNIYCYATGTHIRTATTEEIDRYEALLAELPSAQRDVGAIDGAEFGIAETIYLDR